jgi:poly-beta-hydroxybutyrate-responsive repressor
MCENGQRGHRGHCRVRGLAQPWILLALAQGPVHGYELLERLAEPDLDPGFLYRALRIMEEEGLVRSTWDTTGRGPARRVYTLTEEGWEALRIWAVRLRRIRENLDRFLATYARLEGGDSHAAPPGV